MVSVLEFDPFFCLVNTLRKNYEGLDNNNVTLREETPHQFRRSSYVAKIQKVILKTAYFKNMIPEFREKMKDKLVKKGIMRSNTVFGSTLKDIVQVCHVVIQNVNMYQWYFFQFEKSQSTSIKSNIPNIVTECTR